jgi:hypothetical protein
MCTLSLGRVSKDSSKVQDKSGQSKRNRPDRGAGSHTPTCWHALPARVTGVPVVSTSTGGQSEQRRARGDHSPRIQYNVGLTASSARVSHSSHSLVNDGNANVLRPLLDKHEPMTFWLVVEICIPATVARPESCFIHCTSDIAVRKRACEMSSGSSSSGDG